MELHLLVDGLAFEGRHLTAVLLAQCLKLLRVLSTQAPQLLLVFRLHLARLCLERPGPRSILRRCRLHLRDDLGARLLGLLEFTNEAPPALLELQPTSVRCRRKLSFEFYRRLGPR